MAPLPKKVAPKAVVSAAKPKSPTFASQVKALNPTKKVPITSPYNQRDIDMAMYMSMIKQTLLKKYGGSTWHNKYKNAVATVKTHAANAPDALVYLKQVLKIVDPKATPYTGKAGQKVKPGEFHGLPPPDVKLTPTALALAPASDVEAKRKALEEKITAYKQEIARLKIAQQAAQGHAEKAENEKKNLAGIDPKLLKYFSYIEQNCSEYLKSVKATGKFLFRGQDDAEMPVFVGYPRADREPKDSDPMAQKLVDQCLTAMGFKALRSNSIFTSADEHQASSYGDVYAIFPKNGFHFTWSTKHDDLVINDVSDFTGQSDDSSDLYYDIDNDVIDAIGYIDKYDIGEWYYDRFDVDSGDSKSEKEAEAAIKAIEKSAEYKAVFKARDKWHDKIDEYYSDSKEMYSIVLDIAPKWIAFMAKFPKIAKHMTELTKDIKKYAADATKFIAKQGKDKGGDKVLAAKVIKDFGFKHDDMIAALKSRHEVCVLGEYIAVDYEKYEREIKQFFLPVAEPKKKTLGPAKVPKPKKF